jgi:preprotein translocase subunit SecY
MTAPRIPNFFRDPELKAKILFTLLCLAIYRVGAHIATPGVNVAVLADFMRNSAQGTLFGVYDLFVGGGLSRATVLALGIMPYISASHHLPAGLARSSRPSKRPRRRRTAGRRSPSGPGTSRRSPLGAGQAYGFAVFIESLNRRSRWSPSGLRLPAH